MKDGSLAKKDSKAGEMFDGPDSSPFTRLVIDGVGQIQIACGAMDAISFDVKIVNKPSAGNACYAAGTFVKQGGIGPF